MGKTRELLVGSMGTCALCMEGQLQAAAEGREEHISMQHVWAGTTLWQVQMLQGLASPV